MSQASITKKKRGWHLLGLKNIQEPGSGGSEGRGRWPEPRTGEQSETEASSLLSLSLSLALISMSLYICLAPLSRFAFLTLPSAIPSS